MKTNILQHNDDLQSCITTKTIRQMSHCQFGMPLRSIRRFDSYWRGQKETHTLYRECRNTIQWLHAGPSPRRKKWVFPSLDHASAARSWPSNWTGRRPEGMSRCKWPASLLKGAASSFWKGNEARGRVLLAKSCQASTIWQWLHFDWLHIRWDFNSRK